jgi:hypothetical protein
MKHCLALLFAAALSASLWGLDAQALGQVQYAEGEASFSRNGSEATGLVIGFGLLAGDLVRTGRNGRVVITLDKSTGMAGTITISPSTSLYLDLGLFRGSQRTTLDLLAGSVGAKVKKLAGSPSLQVQTSMAIAGVRGTKFDVSVSLNDAILITCSEGEVSCDDGSGGSLPVAAGRAVERRGKAKAAYLDADPAAIKDFRDRWMEGELAALRSDPRKALLAYEARYARLSEGFKAAAGALASSPVIRKWMDEDRAGARPRALDPAVMREKKEAFGRLKEVRRSIFLFERVYVRVAELEDLFGGGELGGIELRKGYTVGDFFRRFEGEKPLLSGRIGLFHYAMRLYAQRDDGNTELLGSSPIGDSDF